MDEKSKRSILLINYTPFGGGSTVSVYRICDYLISQNYKVGLVTPKNTWLDNQVWSKNKPYIYTLPIPLLNKWRNPFKYIAYIFQVILSAIHIAFIAKFHKWDILHVHCLPNIAGVAGALLCRKRWYWHIHEFYLEHRLAFKLLVQLTNCVSAVKICPSKAVFNIIPSVKKCLLPNTIPSTWFHYGQDNQCLEQNPSLLWIGYVAPRKGLDVFLKAVDLCSVKINAIVIAGIAPKYTQYFNTLMTMSEKIDKNIDYYLDINNPIDLINRCNVLVQTSQLPEAFGLTILEAMALKKAVICSGDAGIADFTENGFNAHYVNVKDPVAVADNIEYVLTNKTYYKKITSNAFETATKYSSETILPNLIEIYEKKR